MPSQSVLLKGGAGDTLERKLTELAIRTINDNCRQLADRVTVIAITDDLLATLYGSSRTALIEDTRGAVMAPQNRSQGVLVNSISKSLLTWHERKGLRERFPPGGTVETTSFLPTVYLIPFARNMECAKTCLARSVVCGKTTADARASRKSTGTGVPK